MNLNLHIDNTGIGKTIKKFLSYMKIVSKREFVTDLYKKDRLKAEAEAVFIAEWNNKHTGHNGSMFVDVLYEYGFSDENIVKVLKSMDSVCQHGCDADSWCQYWNDE